jgi:twinkle protein
VNLVPDDIDFENYFADQFADHAKVKPASAWCESVIARFHGKDSPASWTPLGFNKAGGKFDLRPGELSIWAGINGHGKTSFLSNVMLNVMNGGKRVCLASLEMPPATTMAKMTRQATAVGTPTVPFIRGFHHWTDDRLWIYDHVGRVDAKRMLGVAAYVRNELKIDHLVIDSLMKCGLGTDDYTAQKDFVDSLHSVAKDTGLHIHLVAHMRKGESEHKAPDKMDVKGASEIADIADNVIIVWKNKPKHDALERAQSIKEIDKREPAVAAEKGKPDAFVRVTKQRHFEWEGSLAFWFESNSQQFLESERERPRWIEIEPQGEAA